MSQGYYMKIQCASIQDYELDLPSWEERKFCSSCRNITSHIFIVCGEKTIQICSECSSYGFAVIPLTFDCHTDKLVSVNQERKMFEYRNWNEITTSKKQLYCWGIFFLKFIPLLIVKRATDVWKDQYERSCNSSNTLQLVQY